jgi:hypothetical protein
MVLDGCKLITFFTKNGRFEKKIKNNLQTILDKDELETINKLGFNNAVQDKEIQCNLSITDELKLSISRIQSQEQQQTFIQEVNCNPPVLTPKNQRANKHRACKK